MILKVARIGHPVLRQVARDLTSEEIRSPAIQQLVQDMIETMHEYNGVGLAAPQVHQSLRILVIEAKANPRYPQAPQIPLLVIFNLRLEPFSDEMDEDWEGCLSVPGLRGKVPRYRKVHARGLDRQGRHLDFVAEDFFARVLQHEGDHLDGFVYIDRMRDTKTLSFVEEFHRFQLGLETPSA